MKQLNSIRSPEIYILFLLETRWPSRPLIEQLITYPFNKFFIAGVFVKKKNRKNYFEICIFAAHVLALFTKYICKHMKPSVFSECWIQRSDTQVGNFVLCNIKDIDLKAFPNLTKKDPVKFLNFRRNCITDKGLYYIAQGLKYCPELRELDIQENKLSSLKCLVDVLITHKNLKKLKLSKNSLGNAGALDIARLIKNNNIVEEICLEKAGIHDEGARAILGALRSNNTLRYMELGRNYVDEGIIDSIENLLMLNT